MAAPPTPQLFLTSEHGPPYSHPHRPSTSRSLCDVCGRSMPLTKVGVFRVHGPLSNRCGGSGMLPSSPTAVDSSPLSATINASAPHSVPVPVSNFLIANNFYVPSVIHPGLEFSREFLEHLVTSQPRSLPPSLTT